MTNKKNLVNNILSFLIPFVLFFCVLFFIKNRINVDKFLFIILTVLSVIIFFILNILMHELGHLLFGLMNGFRVLSISIFFIKFTKYKNSSKWSFTKFNEAFGYTEMVSKQTDKIENRFLHMTIGGVSVNFILFLIGVIPFVFYEKINSSVFCLISFCSPVSLLCFLNNFLPIDRGNYRNDGGVFFGLKKNDDVSKVIVNLQIIESLLYNGKAPCEIDKSLYFDVPQLCEDNYQFCALLSARYFYFISCKNYVDAIKTRDRLLEIGKYFDKNLRDLFDLYALYSYCTFDKNIEKADSYVDRIQNYLNYNNDAFTIITKTAYIELYNSDKKEFQTFYDKCLREIKKEPLSGLGRLYLDLLSEINSNK